MNCWSAELSSRAVFEVSCRPVERDMALGLGVELHKLVKRLLHTILCPRLRVLAFPALPNRIMGVELGTHTYSTILDTH